MPEINTKTIKQTIMVNASPHDVCEVLMDSEKHSQLTGSNAKISREIGGSFQIWDGYIEGKNIELIPDTKIVQGWRGEEKCWPQGHYYTITIMLKEEGDRTRLDLTQEDMPEECHDNFFKGWYDNCWDPLRDIFK